MPTPLSPAVDGFTNLPVELFRTEQGFWAFDAHRVVFLAVDHVTYDVLALLRSQALERKDLEQRLPQHSPQEISEALAALDEIQAQGYLMPYAFRRVQRFDDATFEDKLSHELQGFTVFVTTSCNLACSYCVYGGQYARHVALSSQAMSWETAKNMIDFLYQRAKRSKTVRLDFFGGEPLLAAQMVQRCVEYAKQKSAAGGPAFEATIASNGTVMTEELLQFLVRHQIHLQFSIDGAQQSHDRNRPFKKTGRGSYERILRNMQFVFEREPEYFRKCFHLKGVLTSATLHDDDGVFFTDELVKVVAESGNLVLLIEEPHFDLARDEVYFATLARLGHELLDLRGVSTLDQLLARLNVKERAFFQHTFANFFDVQGVEKLYLRGRDEVHFKKGCLTGIAEGAVRPNGEIAICLKATSFVIGNVNEGRWYFDRVRQHQQELTRPWSCSSCLVQRFCELCAEKLGGEGDPAQVRGRFCAFNRQQYRVIFQTMLQVLEHNPDLWQDLDRILTEGIQRKSAASSR
jgi:uncharacterized protein